MTKTDQVERKKAHDALKYGAFRLQVGDFDVTVISDGHLTIPAEIFTADATPQQRDSVLSRLDTDTDIGIINAPTNIPLIRYKNDLIAFDIGGGDRYQPTDGKFLQNLRSAGFDETSVTKVVFTHAHPDHIGATLADDGSLRFPNATYLVGATEWDFWMDPDFFQKTPEALHDFGRGTRRDLSAVRDRVTMIRPGDDVVNGICAFDTPGHTPGHLSFEIAGGDGLIIAADVATSEVVGIENPDWKFGYDTDADLAIKTRRRLIERAAADKVRLLGFHWTYPGIGYVEASGLAHRFIPIK